MNKAVGVTTAAVITILGAGAAAALVTAPPAKARIDPEFARIHASGYLARSDLPNGLALLAPPPAPRSATFARDQAAAAAARRLAGSARWAQATRDANLNFPGAADDFSCALGVEVSPSTTPRLVKLLYKMMIDAAYSTVPTKTKYDRTRPFVADGGGICTPGQANGLRQDGSYPSGHSAIGWAWALVLAEASPDRADAILQRGRSFMQSRVVCNVHWLSDTEAGATLGAAVVSRLHDSPQFRADLAAARSEIAAARAAGERPRRDCKVETAALASVPIRQP